MSARGTRIRVFESFKRGLRRYYENYGREDKESLQRATRTHRLATSLGAEFPGSLSDIFYKGLDIIIRSGVHTTLALFWSSEYLTEDDKERARRIEKRLDADLVLAVSLQEQKDYVLVYRFDGEMIEYIHISKEDFSDRVVRVVEKESSKEPSLFKARRPKARGPHQQKEA